MSVNFTQEQGLEEGSATEQMVLKHATHPVLQVQILGSQHNDELAFIPRITLIPSRQPGFNFCLRRCQFPVRLAFSLMINKALWGPICSIRRSRFARPCILSWTTLCRTLPCHFKSSHGNSSPLHKYRLSSSQCCIPRNIHFHTFVRFQIPNNFSPALLSSTS